MACNLQSINTFLTLELHQYHKSGSMISSSEPVAALSECCLLGSTLCLCLPVQPAQTVLERCPTSWAIDFAIKTFNFLLKQPSYAGYQSAVQTWTQT